MEKETKHGKGNQKTYKMPSAKAQSATVAGYNFLAEFSVRIDSMLSLWNYSPHIFKERESTYKKEAEHLCKLAKLFQEKFDHKKIPEYFKDFDENTRGVYTNEEFFETEGKYGYEIDITAEDENHVYISFWVDCEERLNIPAIYIKTFGEFIINCNQVEMELELK